MDKQIITIWELPYSEEDAVEYFQHFGIIPFRKLCNNGHDMYIDFKKNLWSCNCRVCNSNVPLTKGTWLEGSRISFLTALRFIYCWSQNLTSIKWGKEQLKISEKTVVEWNSYMREVCAHEMMSREKKKIGGPGKIVEIDECVFQKGKNQVETVIPEQWMFGGLCRETNECFIVSIPDRNAATLLECIKNNIEEGTTIVSDCWEGYNSQDLGDANYKHFKVKRTHHFIDPKSGAHTQNIKRLWGSVKESNEKHGGTAIEHLDSYLCEFLWRRLHKEEDTFIAILNSIGEFSPPKLC